MPGDYGPCRRREDECRGERAGRRNALVTGGGSGLGLARAARLRADGATVTIAGRSADRLEAGVAVLERRHGVGAVRRVVAGVTDEDAVRRAVELADEGDGLSIVVASAGVGCEHGDTWVPPRG